MDEQVQISLATAAPLQRGQGLRDCLDYGLEPVESSRGKGLRARAGRSCGHLESVGPLDELDGDDESDRQCDRVEPVVDESVGVAA